MIPLRDTITSGSRPIINYTLIGINIAVYWIQLSQGPDLNRFIYIYGLVPARYTHPVLSDYFTTGQQLFALLSFMFLHGSFWHLLGNMWSLYIFGDNIEDRLGPVRYLAFYLLCGLASGFSHLLLNAQSNVPTIGASGAIAGVMGAYFILYPNAKILTLIPIIIIPYFIEVPAFFFLGIWFVLQFISAAGSHASADMGGIAWWAHIGGFVFGIIFLKLFQRLPGVGATAKLKPMIAKKKSHRLQVIRPAGSGPEPHLYGTINITAFEALAGSTKLVNIPWGFHKRLFKVAIPAGVKTGSTLRLRGLGQQAPDGSRGDLYLKVMIRNGH